MLTAAQTREQTIAVERAFDYMRRHRVTLADLIEVGGADLKSRGLKARRASAPRRQDLGADCATRPHLHSARIGPPREFRDRDPIHTRKTEPEEAWRGSLFASA